MLFILNSDLQIIDTLSLKGIVSQGNTPYFDDYYTQTLATGSETFEFKTIANSKESKNIVVGNYIAFRDDNGEDKLFNIIETIESKSEDGFVKYVYCEMHGIELKNSIIRPTNVLNASVNKFAETILNGTDWSLGKVDDFGTLLDINIEEHTSVYDAIQKYIVGEYGAEIYYTIKIESNSVVSKYLNIVETRGFDDGLKFTYNKNIQNIERTIDTSDLCTALIGVGNNGLTFKNIETEDKPLNQDFVENANAYKQWSVNGYHIFGYEVFDTDSEQELLKLTRAKLEKRGTPKAKYELNVELLDNKVSIGDFVRITDMEFEPPITLGARISVLTKSKTDIDGNTCEISNFQHLQSNITDQMRRLSTTLKGYADNVNIDNINRGGFLTSKIEVVNDDTLKINNSVEIGKDFCFEFKGLTPQPILTNFSFPKGKVMQQAIVDYHENKIYMSYDEHGYGDITLFQLDMSGNILGKMVLNQFGHGNSYGIERRNNKTYIWIECDAKTIYASEPEKLRGTKICYFEFKDGVTATKTYGTVIDILPNWNAMQLAIDDEYNQLAVRALDKTGGTYYYHIYDLKSVINKSPELKYKFKDVGLQGQSAYQGFDILGNYIYATQGAGYYSHPPKMDTYVTCIDIKTGKKRYVNLIDILPDAPYREMEGIKVIKRSERVYELNFGLVTEHESPRKNHIFKYTQTLPLENNPQGKFIHPNGVTTLIQEGLIKIDSSKKKNYLMYVTDGERFGFEDEYSKQIIVANYENGTWYCNGEVFEPMANDCLIGNATSSDSNTFDLTIYSDSPNLIGNTLSGSSGGFIYENGQILVNANSLVGQLPSDLIEVESITANHISASAITADKIQANSIETGHIKAEVFETIDANIQNLVADKANVSDLNATNATIESLKAKDVQIENLVANKANIEDLNATNANIENLQANVANIDELVAKKANITDLNATNANIQNLQANKADIVELNATKGEITQLKSQVAEIGVLKGDVADIENILAGNITADNIASGAITADKIQTGAITAGSSIIAEGAIGSAQISSLDANKITAGEIDTSKVKIKGENGFLFIENNTLYVVDNNRKIRCELGVIENNSNYGFIVRGADGQTIMLDHRGVHNAGITDGAIDNRKVSENANISGKKLDIDSVVRSINEDGSVTLQGTKVQIGNTTLDVKLSEQNNLITEQGQRLATQQSEITANTNAIKLKVDNQIYTEDKKNMTSSLNKATSDISVLQGQIALKVEQTDITNAVNTLSGAVDQKITDAKAEIKATTDSISQRVSSTESTTTNMNTTLNKISGGLNKWLFEVFDRGSVTGTGAITLNHLLGKVPQQTLLVSEPLNSSNLLGIDNFLGRLTTNVYLDADYTWNATAYSDDGSSIYLNGNLIVSMGSCVSTSITMPFKRGWNKITWVFNENAGSDIAYFTPTLSSLSQIKIIDAFMHTNIDEDKVILNSNIANTNNRVAEITTNLDGITQRVSSTESTVTSHTTQLGAVDGKINTAKQDAISSAVGVKDTRNTNENPQWYFTNYPKRTVEEFKYSNKVGISGSNVYGVLTTIVPWTESSGGFPTQTFRSYGTATYTRKGTSNTAWGAWTQVEDTAGSQAKANQALTDAKAFTTTEVTKTNDKVATLETNLNGITQRVSSVESATSTTTRGKNKWKIDIYNLSGLGVGTGETPTPSMIHGKTPNSSLLEERPVYSHDHGSSYLGHAKTNVYLDSAYTWNTSITTDDAGCVYLNGKHILNTTSCVATNITLSFIQGWNTIEVYFIEGGGGDCFNFGSHLQDVSAFKEMNAHIETGLTSSIKTVESKITDTAITNTVSQNFYTKTQTESAITSKGYATTTQVQQTKNDLTASFKESGGYNRVRNGAFLTGDLTHWSSWGSCTKVVENSTDSGLGKVVKITTTGTNQGIQQNITGLAVNKKYVLSALVWASSGVGAVQVYDGSSYPSKTTTTTGTFEKLSVPFTAKATSVTVQLGRHGGGSNGTYYYTGVMLEEGTTETPWSPHPDEVYSGITKIDKDGIQVSQSNISTTTKMNANGFYINKGGTDVFKVDSGGLVMNGNVTATSGRVANFTISGNDLIGSNVGMGGASGTNYAFWAGSNASSSAPFRVGHNGTLTATNATISGTISGASISGSSFSSYGTNSESGQSQSMTLDSGALNLVGTQAGGTNAGQNLNKAMVVSNGFVTKDISDSGNGGNCDAFYSNTGIGWREKSAGGEQTGTFPSIMKFGSDRISTTKNMYAEKFYGAGLFCTYTNIYLGCDGEVRATDMNGRNDGNTVYKPIRASKFMRADGKHAYINNTGGGTLTSADNALVANGIRTDATDFFLGVADSGQVRITNKNGYNSGNGLTYRPILASAHNTSSDLIFKKNIKKFEDSKLVKSISDTNDSYAIQTLKQVGVYQYDLVDGEKDQLGLIAQECPSILRGTDDMYDLDIDTANSITDEERQNLKEKDRNGASINLYAMSSMLWKICQEQQEMIEKLEKRIEELEK